jgi:hypothetical protein
MDDEFFSADADEVSDGDVNDLPSEVRMHATKRQKQKQKPAPHPTQVIAVGASE